MANTDTQQFKGVYVEDYFSGNEDRNKLYTETKDELNRSSSLLAKTMRANGIYAKSDMDYNNSFYRMKRIDPYYMVEGATEMLFFVKPDLNIVDSSGNLINFNYTYTDGSPNGSYDTMAANAGTANIPYFRWLKDAGYTDSVFKNLSYRASSCPFMRILTNRKSSNMDIPDIVADEMESAQNLYGTRIYYPKSSMKSDEDAEFSIEFEDTQFLEIYNLFKAYDMYRQFKWMGMIAPESKYTQYKILHDHMGIFKFLIDNDGETLLYWAYATGVYPKSISRSALSEIQDKGSLRITVTFKLSGWFSDMEPNILAHFDHLVDTYTGRNIKEIPIWDDDIQAVDGSNIDAFYISRDPATPKSTSDSYKRYLIKGYSV